MREKMLTGPRGTAVVLVMEEAAMEGKRAREEVKKRERKRGGKKSAFVLAAVVGSAVWYAGQDESKKRFIKHLLKQVPYLPGRYYA